MKLAFYSVSWRLLETCVVQQEIGKVELTQGLAYGWVVLERGWVRFLEAHNDWESQEAKVLWI